MSNQHARVDLPLSQVTGPLFGSNLLEAFKQELITEPVFQTMFGVNGERIFHAKRPNMNETILPALLLTWKQETFNSGDSYFEGSLDGLIVLPITLDGDFNAKRRVGSLFQRFMGGRMNVFSNVPGLIKFGYGTQFNYEGLARFDGISAPAIQMTIPFKFDLQLVRLKSQYDPLAPLDNSDIGFVTEYLLKVTDVPTGQVLQPEGVMSVTGQTN
jgi:hypothetical protein